MRLDTLSSAAATSSLGATDTLVFTVEFTDAAGVHEQQVDLGRNWTQFTDPILFV